MRPMLRLQGRRIARDEFCSVLLDEMPTPRDEVSRLVRGVGHQLAPTGVVGALFDRAQDERIETVSAEPNAGAERDLVLMAAAARGGHGLRQLSEKLRDQFVAAGVSRDVNCGAVLSGVSVQ